MSAAAALSFDQISELVNKELPTLPGIIYEIRKVMDDPMSSTVDVEKVMANDPSLTTKVLRLVNSAYYSIPGGVTQLSRAIGYLGFDTVHQLVLSTSIIESMQAPPSLAFDITEFWKHSLGVAIASESIATLINYPIPADLFTCGLIHDIGKIGLFTLNPELMLTIVQEAHAQKITYLEAERNLGVTPHTQMGYILTQKWKLPLGFQSVVKYHHSKNLAERGSLSADLNLMVDIVYLGNILTHILKFGDSGHPVISGVPKDILQRLSVDPDKDFKELLHHTKEQMGRADEFVKILGDKEKK